MEKTLKPMTTSATEPPTQATEIYVEWADQRFGPYASEAEALAAFEIGQEPRPTPLLPASQARKVA